MTEAQCRQDLADLYSAIALYKWDDLIYTHASLRIPGTNSFLINQFGIMFSEVTPENLVLVDMDSANESINLAGFNIHNSVYKARPEINCVIHTHTKEGVAVSASTKGLLPISQYSVSVVNSLAYHSYNGIAVDKKEEASIQQDLGTANHMILRNHGLLTVGHDVTSAFFNMYNLQKACEVQVLTDTSDCVLIDELVLRMQPLMVAKFNKHGSHRDLAWQAIKRLIKND